MSIRSLKITFQKEKERYTQRQKEKDIKIEREIYGNRDVHREIYIKIGKKNNLLRKDRVKKI